MMMMMMMVMMMILLIGNWCAQARTIRYKIGWSRIHTQQLIVNRIRDVVNRCQGGRNVLELPDG